MYDQRKENWVLIDILRNGVMMDGRKTWRVHVVHNGEVNGK